MDSIVALALPLSTRKSCSLLSTGSCSYPIVSAFVRGNKDLSYFHHPPGLDTWSLVQACANCHRSGIFGIFSRLPVRTKTAARLPSPFSSPPLTPSPDLNSQPTLNSYLPPRSVDSTTCDLPATNFDG
jgi:hypothetical protein